MKSITIQVDLGDKNSVVFFLIAAVPLELFNLLGLLMIKVPLHRVYQLKAILHEFLLYVDDIVG